MSRTNDAGTSSEEEPTAWVQVPMSWIQHEQGRAYLTSGGRSFGPVLATRPRVGVDDRPRFGPYDDAAQALREPLPEQIDDLHRAGQVRAGDPDRVVAGTQAEHLRRACDDAGVELGAYDARIVEWLGGWDPATVQVVIGLISRAGRARSGPDRTADHADAGDAR